MLNEMNKHYGSLKNKMGIFQISEEKPRDLLSSQAFSKLRPFTAYSLYDVIEPKKFEECKKERKTNRIRFISRSNSKPNVFL